MIPLSRSHTDYRSKDIQPSFHEMDHNLTGTCDGQTLAGTQTKESTIGDHNLASSGIQIDNGGKPRDNIELRKMGVRREDANFDLKINSRNMNNSSGQLAYQLRSKEASKNYLAVKGSLKGQNQKTGLKKDNITTGIYNNPQTISSQGWMVQNRPQTHGLKSTSLSKRSLRVTNKTFDDGNLFQQTTSSNEPSSTNLVLTKADLSSQIQREKGLKTGHSRMTNTVSTDEVHFQMGLRQKTPMTLDLVRENHLSEYSITCKTKTNKTGVFEKEKTSERSLDRDGEMIIIGGEQSFKRHQLQSNQFKMPDIRSGFRSRTHLKHIQSPSTVQLDAKDFQKVSTPYLGGYGSQEFDLNGISQSSGSPMRQLSQFQQASLLLHQSQSKMLDSQHSLMQSELKELIKMEPYTHRAKQLVQTQQASVITKNNSVSMDQQSVLMHNETKERRIAPKMSNKEIYEWLNDTLTAQMQEEAENFNIVVQQDLNDLNSNVTIPRNDKKRTPLISLEIDRIALDKAGVEQQEVNRIYKALYVSSVGFYSILKTALSRVQQNQKYKVMGRLWKAFEMLLENCQPTDFKMVGQKLREDQIKEINKVTDDFNRCKDSLEIQKTNLMNELKDIKVLYDEVLEEKEMQTDKCMKAEHKYLHLQQKYEEEIRLRLDFEIKINKLYGLNVALRSSELSLKRKIEDIEATMLEYKERNKVQAEEIVMLRSCKLQSEMIKQIDDVKIEVVEQHAMQAKQKLISAVENLQQADKELSHKTHLNLQLQSVVDNRESRIRALQDIVKANKDKDEEVNKLYNTQNSLMMQQEKIIREHMRSLNQTDGELSSTKKHLNETLFNAFEMQNMKARVQDLENYLDKLLGETTDQRELIENFTEKVAQQKQKIDGLIASQKAKSEKIQELQKAKSELETNLTSMTHSRNQLKISLDDLEIQILMRNKKIGEFETQIYLLKKKVDELEKSDEEKSAEISREKFQSDQQKSSALTWETKFHKQVIANQKVEQQFKVFQDETTLKHAQHDEREKELQFVMEGKKMMINSLQIVLNKVKEEKAQSQLALLRSTIRKDILQRLLYAFLSHFLALQSEQLDEIIQLKDREANNQSKNLAQLSHLNQMLERTSIELEDWKGQAEKFHQNLWIFTAACELQSSKAAILSEKIDTLEKQLQTSEKLADDRKALINKIKASHKQEVEKMERIMNNQEEGAKVSAEKINIQAKKMKELYSETEGMRSAQNSSIDTNKSRQQSSSEIDMIYSRPQSTIQLKVKINVETQTEPPSLQNVMIQTSQQPSEDTSVVRQTEKSFGSSDKMGKTSYFHENRRNTEHTVGQMVTQKQTTSHNFQQVNSVSPCSPNSATKNAFEPKKHTIEHKSPLFSKKVSIISGSKNNKSSRQNNSSKKRDSSSSSIKKHDLVNLSINKKSESGHGETSKEVDYSQMVSNPIQEIQSSNEEISKEVTYRNKTSQGPRLRTNSMLKTPTDSQKDLNAIDFSHRSHLNRDLTYQHSRVTVHQQILQPESEENSENVTSNKKTVMQVGSKVLSRDTSAQRAQIQNNSNRSFAAASLSNSREDSSPQNEKSKTKPNLKLKNQKPRASNIKGLLKSALNRP